MHRYGAFLSLIAVMACGSSGGSSSATTASLPECQGQTLPSTLHVTVSGFTSCTCFNGSFTLTEASAGIWSGPAINGCPGQNKTAYLKVETSSSPVPTNDGLNGGASPDAGPYANIAFGITDSSSLPGLGDSDMAVPTSVSCSPLAIEGGGSRAGNITSFCPSAEDENMKWTVGP